jgi:hypothetical protein
VEKSSVLFFLHFDVVADRYFGLVAARKIILFSAFNVSQEGTTPDIRVVKEDRPKKYTKSSQVSEKQLKNRLLLYSIRRLGKLLNYFIADNLGAGATFDWLFFDNSKVINFDD